MNSAASGGRPHLLKNNHLAQIHLSAVGTSVNYPQATLTQLMWVASDEMGEKQAEQ